MKRLSVILIVAGSLMYCSVGKADITSVQFQDDGNGAITFPLYTWSGTASDLSLSLNGVENRGGAARILGTITTDTTTDPTLTLSRAIDNDTDFAWTAYYVNIYMDVNFTLSNVNVTLPADWTVASAQQPVPVVSPYGSYEAQVEFSSGTPVAIGDELDFGYTISFIGPMSFTEEMIPVPEPGTFGFLAAGALSLGGFLAARRRNRLS
ncbi:MAG: PEP-CTERM sorting domain-containing protein [Verrucomicrobiota bacterium]|jgi:hypothetical protein